MYIILAKVTKMNSSPSLNPVSYRITLHPTKNSTQIEATVIKQSKPRRKTNRLHPQMWSIGLTRRLALTRKS